ncbi:MAG: beta-N-acetylhexosaminidase [Lacibacter sp.]
MRLLVTLTCMLAFMGSTAQTPGIIPIPTEMQMVQPGKLQLRSPLLFKSALPRDESERIFKYLQQELLPYGIALRQAATTERADLSFRSLRMPGVSEEAYRLVVTDSGITISAVQGRGAFYGVQTLLQLLPVQPDAKPAIPFVKIFDAPRFAYRGMHLDVGRHFFPVAYIKRYIDYLALHKINTFHWHLTEDQGWRIEIKQFPELTRVGAWRNGTIIGRYPGTGNDNKPYGGFYTQEEIREVVQYARSRFIDVIPEIEMPGHSSAAIAAYPWLSCFPDKPTFIPATMISEKSVAEQKAGRVKLVQETWGIFDDVYCAGNDSVFWFLERVLDEVVQLFPGRYVHIGGDECPKTHWKQCPRCQQRMKTLHLKDEHELQSYFVQRIEKYLNSKGKTLIGWDEILEGGLAPNAVVMSWRGEKGGIEAARQKHRVIMTPGKPLYFDHSQTRQEDSVTIGGYNPLEAVYAYNPLPGELEPQFHPYIMGAQANVWTEYMNNTHKVEYMIFPRMAALSEALWSRPEQKTAHPFEPRLLQQLERYKRRGIHYSRAVLQPTVRILPDAPQTVVWQVDPRQQNDSVAFFEQINSEGSTNRLQPLAPLPGLPHRVRIGRSGTAVARVHTRTGETFETRQAFQFSLTTSCPLTLTHPAAAAYPGDGAFTLVNGVINTKGLQRTQELLGFSGTDCEAVIDLGVEQLIRHITAHTWEQTPSWIWRAAGMDVAVSNDGKNFSTATGSVQTAATTTTWKADAPLRARYVKVRVRNRGTIPEGNPGAGQKAWLFVSELEVQ